MAKQEKKLLIQYTNDQGLTITAKVTHEHLIELSKKFTIYILK